MTKTPASIMNSRAFRIRHGVSALLVAASLGIAMAQPAAIAAPSANDAGSAALFQNVDWMSSDTASYLAGSGMPVMVPSWVPSPFTGVEPSVYADGSSYSLYWMVDGGAPTFLQITGVVGGQFPAGSKADLNVQLFVNSTVQGWDAVHDIGIPAGGSSPIYDQIWWIAGGVLYSVESLNIGSDSTSIANSMIFLEAAAAVPTEAPVEVPTEAPYEEPTIPPTEVPVVAPVEVPTEVPVDVPAETPVTDNAVEQVPADEFPADIAQPSDSVPTAPADETPVSEDMTSSDVPADSNVTDPTPTTVVDAAEEAAAVAASATEEVIANTGPWSPQGGQVPSDGTAGPASPVIGGDGTGGLFDTSVP